MIQSDLPDTVTVLASPPAGMNGTVANGFIDEALEALSSKQAAGHRIVRASSIRDADLELGKITSGRFKGTIRLQIVGHSISGMLSLGASWIPEREMASKAFRYPYYVLDTNPASLGLLAKYAGKISEVLLVGCNIGSATSFGYAINGRTLTYTLAELLRCLVRGADDVVAPDEFDERGWYAPRPNRRRPKGWRWVDDRQPMWSEAGIDPVPGARPKISQAFEIRSITSALLPVSVTAEPRKLDRAIQITCQRVAPDKPESALPELWIETDQGPAQLLCGGRYLHWKDTYYVVDPSPQMAASLTSLLWGSETLQGPVAAPPRVAH